MLERGRKKKDNIEIKNVAKIKRHVQKSISTPAVTAIGRITNIGTNFIDPDVSPSIWAIITSSLG